MKILKCLGCEKTYKDGKFCLDCGQKLIEIITSDIKFKAIDTSRTSDVLKRDVRKWLNRIGVQNPDIQIYTGDGNAEVEYTLNQNQYKFKSVMQKNVTTNMAAVEQFLHYRVLGIERGIETKEQAFKGYEALPDPTKRLQGLSDEELKKEIKAVHPDTGTGDKEVWNNLMKEKKRRGQSNERSNT